VACREYLGQLRWPDGFTCPECGCGGGWRTGKGLWMCVECGKKTSVTAGTIFHRSHTPLLTWFAAVWFVTSQKNGVSAQGLKDALGFGSYETAWAWLHKLRRAMVRPDRELLSGVVELDQSFVGGRATGKRGPSSDKAPITIAVERDDRGRLGRVRLELADKPGGLDMIDFACDCDVVAPGATICTDGARMFTRLAGKGYIHRPTPGNTADDLDAVMPGPHLVSSPSSVGPSALCTTGSAASICPITSTNSRSDSTAERRGLGECCSTDSCSRPWTPTRTRSRS